MVPEGKGRRGADMRNGRGKTEKTNEPFVRAREKKVKKNTNKTLKDGIRQLGRPVWESVLDDE